MSWSAVKDLTIRKWGPWQVAAHSRIGRAVRLSKLRAAARALLAEAQSLTGLNDEELKKRARRTRAELSKESGDPVEVFPLILEAIRRETTFILHTNQVVAAMAMSRGQMVELATGEGKTLVTMLTAAAQALSGRRVHVFTANRYLAQRDGELAAKLCNRLGLRVGSLKNDLPPPERVLAYQAPILYSTLAEVAFDWLRDRLTMCRGEGQTLVPRLDSAIVDEADMVMIDDARTPLVLAENTGHDPTALYQWAAGVADRMRAVEDYTSSGSHVELTPAARRWFYGLGGESQALVARSAVLATLRARLFYRRNVHYIVQDGEVVIVDEKTGRLMPGRRWHDGLHEAVTIREGLELDGSHRNTAQITVQQYLAQYDTLCGCSGTMAEAAVEMYSIYGLSTLRVPTHRRCRRKTWRSTVYATREAQFRAVAEQVKRLREQGRPVLVGSTHIATSERLSELFKTQSIEHALLTALEEKREAEIVELAGLPGAVTIATNMAGRGTDIKLAPESAAAGGLHVISLQRHDSSRVDRQLVGRCARQGDPGSCQFVLCIQDPLLRPHIARLRRKHLTRATRDGQPIRRRGLLQLWTRRQRTIESEHLRMRLALIQRESSLQALYGKPPYLADQPPVKPRPALV